MNPPKYKIAVFNEYGDVFIELHGQRLTQDCVDRWKVICVTAEDGTVHRVNISGRHSFVVTIAPEAKNLTSSEAV